MVQKQGLKYGILGGGENQLLEGKQFGLLYVQVSSFVTQVTGSKLTVSELPELLIA